MNSTLSSNDTSDSLAQPISDDSKPFIAAITEAVRAYEVTSADFNGKSFDGSPFKTNGVSASWLIEKFNTQEIFFIPSNTDYAVFGIGNKDERTNENSLTQLWPGDWLVLLAGDVTLKVVEYSLIRKLEDKTNFINTLTHTPLTLAAFELLITHTTLQGMKPS